VKTTVTIGIPTLTAADAAPGWARLERCLISIEQCTNFDRFDVKVIVCDDGSSSDNLALNKTVIHNRPKLQGVAGLEMLMSEHRSGIAASWNKLTRHRNSQVVALLNDDIEVVDDWLDVLVYSVMENPSVGMVGLNSYLALTKEQHADVFPKTAKPHEMVPLIDYREAHLLDGGGSLISAQGAIFAFRRDAFELVGGFDERYFVYYEETDFGVALRKQKLYPFMANHPVVYHMGGATNSDPRNLDAAAHMARSKGLFMEKWGKSFSELRQEFVGSYTRPNLREWNSQIANWT
jgi:GT2 family glycosyltransferase